MDRILPCHIKDFILLVGSARKDKSGDKRFQAILKLSYDEKKRFHHSYKMKINPCVLLCIVKSSSLDAIYPHISQFTVISSILFGMPTTNTSSNSDIE